MLPNQCIIVGGGLSIKTGIKKGLWDILGGRFTIAINDAYRYLDATILTYMDRSFQVDNWSDIKDYGLHISRSDSSQKIGEKDNIYLFPTANDYDRSRAFKDGIYKYYLTGIWALSIAIKLLGEGEIFLLGFDAKSKVKEENGKTVIDNNFHDYNKNQILNYNTKIKKINSDFQPFVYEKQCKIYNVCPDSNIVMFNKIDYSKFFSMLNDELYDQAELRKEVRRLIDAQG